ncbi:hypothetical protein Rmet_6467 [Cupriavidus metallidurans CH34]|uniref:Uncharacterized protein n=1 Tax=Cupriavidus metallidurans (strain ATCC 43123 / DSM 2839 / NBRC 102507 / CH34) TaxID=266264 RepID=D3DXQ9_CUPMC|nr:hypothetical protein Rmet_6467 [Cupriavidus metallidurans CH34]
MNSSLWLRPIPNSGMWQSAFIPSQALEVSVHLVQKCVVEGVRQGPFVGVREDSFRTGSQFVGDSGPQRGRQMAAQGSEQFSNNQQPGSVM